MASVEFPSELNWKRITAVTRLKTAGFLGSVDRYNHPNDHHHRKDARKAGFETVTKEYVDYSDCGGVAVYHRV